MSATTLALILAFASASTLGPPALPPESAPAPVESSPSPDAEAAPRTGESQPPQDPPAGGKGDATTAPAPEFTPPPAGPPNLPPGIEPVPNPFDSAGPAPAPPPTPGGEVDPLAPAPTAPPPRRSVIDLRDPFNRPPPRTEGNRRRTAKRMIIPDLKDPFAPGVRRVRSKKLSGLRDIRDPFRDGQRPDNPRPPCVRTTDDGTVVQAPGQPEQQAPECQPGTLDLRDPFQPK